MKNAEATIRLSHKPPPFLSQTCTVGAHIHALQALSNGTPVPYAATLRAVLHEGNREPKSEKMADRKYAGFIRNEFGGYFTS